MKALTLVGCLLLVPLTAAAQDLRQARLRRPIALALDASAQRLYVANQRSGSLSVIGTADRQVLAEVPLGDRLSDVVLLPDGRLAVIDESRHELLVLRPRGSTLDAEARVDVPAYPVSVQCRGGGRLLTVASLWSHQLTQWEVPAAGDGPPQLQWTLNLPFAPRCQLPVNDGNTLIVADSFRGQLAIVDARQGRLEQVRSFPGHNIRGLSVSANGRMLLVAHQMLNELAHTVRNDVHWGLLMSNDLRWLRLDAVLDDDEELYDGAHMHPLGQPNSATGDPSGLAVAADGTVVVALGGVGEMALGLEEDFSLHRVRVGRRPTAVVIDDNRRLVYVANTFSDSVSVVDIDRSERLADIVLGPQPELTAADRGELLFHDASLSHDSWMSCHSCHTDGHTNSMLNDNLSDKTFGAPKRVLSLLGRHNTPPFAWNGENATLNEQIRTSITSTMQSDRPPRQREVEQLAAFLRTLPAPPAVESLRGRADQQAIARGRQLFDQLDCVSCHEPPRYTTPDVFDVGLRDELGNERFNPPSLRGLAQRGPFFHDGRAETLEQVVRKYRHQLDEELSTRQQQDLLSFLRSL